MIVTEKIWTLVIMGYLIAQFIKYFVALRKDWYNGSKAKYEAKKAQLVTRQRRKLQRKS